MSSEHGLRFSAEMKRVRSHYDVLGVSPEASAQEINAAFRTLAQEHHPDREGGSETRMKEISAAYSVLKNPETRAAYDEELNPRTRLAPRPRGSKPPDSSRATPEKPERLTPEQIKEKAVLNASISPNTYTEFVRELEKEGYPDVNALIRDPDVVSAIKNQALRDAYPRASYLGALYGPTMSNWAEAGFDRNLVDSSPELLEIISEQLARHAGDPLTFSFRLKDWMKDARIGQDTILNSPVIIEALRTEAEKARKDKRLDAFLKDWERTAKINLLPLLGESR